MAYNRSDPMADIVGAFSRVFRGLRAFHSDAVRTSFPGFFMRLRQLSRMTRGFVFPRCFAPPRGGRRLAFLSVVAWVLVLGAVTPWTALSAQGVQDIDLPDMGEQADRTVSPYLERRIGKQLLRRLWKSNAVINDALTQEYMKKLGSRLLLKSGRSPADFTFLVVADNRINAFAAPGGLIGIHSGVFLSAQSVHELSAVTAHEIAHVTQRHIARAEHSRRRSRWPLTASLVAAMLLGGYYDAELGSAAAIAISAGHLQQQINFTRSNEQEADRIGMQYLQRADYDPRGMPEFFGRLLRQSRLHSRDEVPEYLRTHPLTVNRIAESRSLAESYDTPPIPTDLDFQLVRTRLQVGTNPRSGEVLQRFKLQVEKSSGELLQPSKLEQYVARYGYALVLAKRGNFQQALAELLHVEKVDGPRLLYLLARGELESELGRIEQALATLRRAEMLYPTSVLPLQGQARVLLSNGRPKQAQQLLRNYGRQHPHDVFYYRLLAQAEAEAGFKSDSDIARAELFFLQGSTGQAIKLLQAALLQKGLSHYHVARIRARLLEMRASLELEKQAGL